MNNKLRNKLERLHIKRTLMKVKDILISERNKGYYRNAMNIKEIIDINIETRQDIENNQRRYITKLIIYQNGFSEFCTLEYNSTNHQKKELKK